MRREIGSYQSSILFQEENNNYFNNDLKWFVSGRAALDFIIKDIKNRIDFKTVALPSWCCDSMIDPFVRNGIEVKFYPILYKDNRLIKDINIKADALLYLDYFGFEHTNIEFDGIVINDITHSVFTDIDNISDYTFCSLRKWAGFKTCGYAYSKNGFSIEYKDRLNEEYNSLRKQAMEEKEAYLSEEINNKDYYQKFVKAEEDLYELYDYASFKQDIDDAYHFDINKTKQIRIDNTRKLLETVKEYAMFKQVNDNDCPLYLPIIVPNGKKEELRRYLIKHDIYCPTHWALTNLHKLTDEERYIYDNELSLICDQRYNREDMKYMCKHIKEFFKENKC